MPIAGVGGATSTVQRERQRTFTRKSSKSRCSSSMLPPDSVFAHRSAQNSWSPFPSRGHSLRSNFSPYRRPGSSPRHAFSPPTSPKLLGIGQQAGSLQFRMNSAMERAKSDVRHSLGKSVSGTMVLATADEVATFWGNVRYQCQAITQRPGFNTLVMFLIVCNSVLLALDDPKTETDPLWYKALDIVFTFLFTIECILKLTAEGTEYFKSGWNLFDFIVVLESLYSTFAEFSNSIDISWLRALRVLRPLRTVKRLPSMRLVVMATLHSFHPLRLMFLIYLAYLFACAALCCNIWAGKLRYVCYDTMIGEYNNDGDMVCNAAHYTTNSEYCLDIALWDSPFDCSSEPNSVCVDSGQSPNNGLTSFDNMGIGLLVLFEVTTLEGWVGPLEWTQAATSVWSFLVFTFVIVTGAYILVNMIVAALLIEFQRAQMILNEEQIILSEEQELDISRPSASPASSPSSSSKRSFIPSHRNLQRDSCRDVTIVRTKINVDQDCTSSKLSKQHVGKNVLFNDPNSSKDEHISNSCNEEYKFIDDNSESSAMTLEDLEDSVVLPNKKLCYHAPPRLDSSIGSSPSQVSFQNQLTTLNLPESPKRRALEKLPLKTYGDSFEVSFQNQPTTLNLPESPKRRALEKLPLKTYGDSFEVPIPESLPKMGTLAFSESTAPSSLVSMKTNEQRFQKTLAAEQAILEPPVTNRSTTSNQSRRSVTSHQSRKQGATPGVVPTRRSPWKPSNKRILSSQVETRPALTFNQDWAETSSNSSHQTLESSVALNQINKDSDFRCMSPAQKALSQSFFGPLEDGEKLEDCSFMDLLPEKKKSFAAPPHRVQWSRNEEGRGTEGIKPLESLLSKSSQNPLERVAFAKETIQSIKSPSGELFFLSSALKTATQKKEILLPSEVSMVRMKTAVATYVRRPRLASISTHASTLQQSRRSSIISNWSMPSKAPTKRPSMVDSPSSSGQRSTLNEESLNTLSVQDKLKTNLQMSSRATVMPAPTPPSPSNESLKERTAFKHRVLDGVRNKYLIDLCTKDGSSLSKFIFGCIALNILLLALDGHGISQTMEDFLYYSNLVFVAIFSLEMVFKLFVLGIRGYFKSIGNDIDAAIVTASWIELGLLSASASLSSLRVLTRVFRALRVTRISKLAHQWPALLKVIRILIHSFHGVGPAMCLSILCIFVFSVLGMQIFGTTLDGSGESEKEIRYRFDSFQWAFFSVFYLLIGDNWSDMMQLAMEKTSMWSCLYFVGVILAANWILVNMILAIVLSGCSTSINNRTEITQFIHRLNLRVRKLYLRYAWRLLKEHAQKEIKKELSMDADQWKHTLNISFCRQWTRQESQATTLCLVHGYRDQRTQLHDLPINFFELYRAADEAIDRLNSQRLEQTSFDSTEKKLKGTEKAIRAACYRLSKSKKTHRFMRLVVVISWGLMFDSTGSIAIWVVELLLTLIFTAEIVWKSVARGFYSGRKAYIKSMWNLLDLFLVVCSVILLALEKTNSTQARKVFSGLKSLRPARLINKIDECRDLLDAIVHSLTCLGTVCILIFALWFIYAIIGMQLFKGTFYSCSDENFPEGAYRYGETNSAGEYTSPPCSGTYINATTGEEVTRSYTWENAAKSFDNIIAAMGTVFYLSTLEGWQTPLFSAFDLVGEDYQPKTFNSRWVFVYFAVGCCLFGLYTVNLLVASVFESFIEKTSYTKDGIRLDNAQRIMKMYQHRLMQVKPKKRPKAIHRGLFYQKCNIIAKSRTFKHVIIAVLCLNGITLMISHADQPASVTSFQSGANVFFGFAFMMEALIKILGLGHAKYFSSKAHCFDFAVALASVCGLFFHLVAGCTYESNFLLQLFITTRVFRTLSLISYFKALRQYTICVLYPLPKLVNLFLLMSIGVFIYANVGYQIFADVIYESPYTNFHTLRNSLQLMAVATTGEFAGYLEITLESSAVSHVLIYFFFCSFFLIMSFLLVNMFVMFIIETFELLNSENVSISIEQLIPVYKKVWSKYDPEATGYIAPYQLSQFLLDLPSEIGVARTDSFLYLVHAVDRIEMQPEYDYSFNKTLVSLCVIACYPDTLAEVETSQDLYLLFRKLWAVIIIKKCVKEYVQWWKLKKEANSKTVRSQ